MRSTRPGLGASDDAEKTPRASGAWFLCHARAEFVAERCEHAAGLMQKRLELVDIKGARWAGEIATRARDLAAQFAEWRPTDQRDFEGWAALRDALMQVEEDSDAMFAKHDTHPTVKLQPVGDVTMRPPKAT